MGHIDEPWMKPKTCTPPGTRSVITSAASVNHPLELQFFDPLSQHGGAESTCMEQSVSLWPPKATQVKRPKRPKATDGSSGPPLAHQLDSSVRSDAAPIASFPSETLPVQEVFFRK